MVRELKIPLHITGFWIPHYTSDPITTGSLGVGLTLEPVVTSKNFSEKTLKLNSVEVGQDLKQVMESLAGVKDLGAFVASPVGLGQGLGLSAALSITLATSALIKRAIPITLKKVGILAHIAEVTLRTGLGDVIAELIGGGLVIRLKPGPPGVGEVDVVPVKENVTVCVGLVKKGLTTPEMLKLYAGKIRKYGLESYLKFLRNPSLDTFIEQAHEFSVKTGMLENTLKDKVDDSLRTLLNKGAVLGYFVKKGTIAVLTQANYVNEAYEVLKKVSEPLGAFKICRHGTLFNS